MPPLARLAGCLLAVSGFAVSGFAGPVLAGEAAPGFLGLRSSLSEGLDTPAAIGLRPSIRAGLESAAPEVAASVPDEARALWAVPPVSLPRGGAKGEAAILLDAVSLAIDESPLVRGAIAEKGAAEARVGKAWAAFAPVVSGNAWIGRDPFASPSFEDPGKTATLSIGLPLIDGGQRWFNKNSAENAALAAAADVRRTKETVALDTMNAAIELDFAQRQSRLLEESFRDLAQVRQAVRARVESGHASEGDIADLEAELADIARTLVAAQTSAEKSQAVLASQLRQASPGRFVLPDLESVPRRGLDGLIRLVRTRNAGLQASWHRYNAASEARDATIGRYLPRVDFKADYRVSQNYRSFSAPQGWTVGLQLNMPIVDLGTVADIREAGAFAEAAMYRAMEEDRKVTTQLRLDWADIEASAKRAQLARRKIVALRTAYATKLDQYGIGLIPIDDVLLTRRRLILASIEEVEAGTTRFAAIARLTVTAGLLPEVAGRS